MSTVLDLEYCLEGECVSTSFKRKSLSCNTVSRRQASSFFKAEKASCPKYHVEGSTRFGIFFQAEASRLEYCIERQALGFSFKQKRLSPNAVQIGNRGGKPWNFLLL